MAQSGRSPRNPASGAAKESEAFREFRPHPVMKTFLYAASFLTLALSVFPWSIPVTVFTDEPAVDWIIGVGVHVLTLLIAVLLLLWVPRYYRSAKYGMDDQWLYAEGGVVWRRRTRLPVGRVQLVNVTQGPWQRAHGVASVCVYTAATGQPTAELVYMNVSNAEALRDRVLELAQRYRSDASGLGEAQPGRARGSARVAPAAAGPQAVEQASPDVATLLSRLLDEVRSIRDALTRDR